MSGDNAAIKLGRLTPDAGEAAARLIHQSLSFWYDRNLNQPDRFGADWEPFLIFPDVYQGLDPDCAVTARDAVSGLLLGVCFYHPRPTHLAVGIVATHPEAGGRGVARAMLQEVLAIADVRKLPVRLVSSLMNLDSFSLYTKLGFVPGIVFQDLQFPPGLLPPLRPHEGSIRPATMDDVPAMADLEERRTGIRRDHDFAWFVRNEPRIWHTLVLSGSDGGIRGFLGSLSVEGIQMIGPGWMENDADALALIAAQLHHHAPGNPVFLVPARAAGLVASLYQAGARNVELHVAQVRGPAMEPQGIVIPTFLPESG
jgi:ribosomal protein S18 acetylase RimI-like enzyme